MFGRIPLYVYSPKNVGKRETNYIGKEAIDYLNLFKEKIPVTSAFFISAHAFDSFLETTGLVKKIALILKSYNPLVKGSAESCSQKILEQIFKAEIVSSIKNPIMFAYKNLSKEQNLTVLVRQSHFLSDNLIPERERSPVKYVSGERALEWAILNSWASFFSTEAIELRASQNYTGQLTLGLIVQIMNLPEISGKIYTIPPVTQETNLIEIRSIYGINDIEGYTDANSDIYKVDKKTGAIVDKKLVQQGVMKIIKKKKSDNPIDEKVEVEISKNWKNRQKISNEKIIELAKIGKKVSTIFKDAIELSWGMENGIIKIDNFKVLRFIKKEPVISIMPSRLKLGNNISIAEETVLKKINSELEKLPAKNKTLAFRKLELELRSNPVKEVSTKIASIPGKIPVYLNISEMNSAKLAQVKNFSGGFFDASAIPGQEELFKAEAKLDKQETNKLLNNFSINIKVVTNIIESNPLFYRFSDGKHTAKNVDDYSNMLAIQATAIKNVIESAKKTPNLKFILSSIRSIEEIKKIKKELYSSTILKINRKNTFYVEIEIPSLLMDIDKFTANLTDGVIINFENLGKIFFYKNQLDQVELSKLENLTAELITMLKEKNIETIVKADGLSSPYLLNLLKTRVDGIIVSKIPSIRDNEQYLKEESKWL